MHLSRFKYLLPPVFMSVYPILAFYLANTSQLSMQFLQTPIFYSVCASLVIFFLFSFLTRNKNKSTAITTLFLFIFYSYGHVSKFLDDKLFIRVSEKFILGPDKILIPLVFVLCLFLTRVIIKSRTSMAGVNLFLTVTLSLLISFSVFSVVSIENQKNHADLTNSNPTQTQLISASSSDLPDIYYIILDGYASGDTLANVYAYDNTEFINSLKDLGFYVADKSRSNYLHTYLSLPSALNMRYLDDLPEKHGTAPVDDRAAIDLLYHNLTSDLLRQSGYTTMNFETWWNGTNENYPADVKFSYKKNYQIAGMDLVTSETNMVFLQTTLVSPVIKEIWDDVLRGKVITVFQKLPDIPYLAGKKFVLAHITSPHPPYIFTRTGEPVTGEASATGDEGVEKRGYYLDQLIYVSNQIIPVLQKIISNSKTPPIIILQSDHGPASVFGKRDDWKKNYSPEGLGERAGILYAVYFPDQDYRQLYQTITPVNTFRILFNKYFNLHLPLLPDKTYYNSYTAIYGFTSIAD